jgi:hypothetical protein
MNKHIFFTAILVFAAMLLTSCDPKSCDCDQPESALTLTFKATYGGAPLVKNQLYDYDDFKIQFTRFNAYVSNITLVDERNTDVQVSDIQWVDFTPDFAPNNNAVDVTVKINVPQGKYKAIKLGYGVPESLNAKRPSDFAAGHPLTLENEYWSGWRSYIFNKIEGEADSDNNGINDLFLSYHSGSDEVFRTYEFNHDLDMSADNSMTVEFDLKNVFFADGAWFDMAAPNNQATSNDINDVRVATILMNNFDNATTIK